MVAITGVREFVENFNLTFLGAPRPIQEADVLKLSELGLIKTHDCFSRDDYKTALSILKLLELYATNVPTQMIKCPIT